MGVWGEAPHIALLLFAEKQKGRFLEVPFILFNVICILKSTVYNLRILCPIGHLGALPLNPSRGAAPAPCKGSVAPLDPIDFYLKL